MPETKLVRVCSALAGRGYSPLSPNWSGIGTSRAWSWGGALFFLFLLSWATSAEAASPPETEPAPSQPEVVEIPAERGPSESAAEEIPAEKPSKPGKKPKIDDAFGAPPNDQHMSEGDLEEAVDTKTPRTNESYTRNRMVLTPTAFGVGKEETHITGYLAGLWILEYGLTDHLVLGITSAVPVGGFTLGAHLMVHGKVSEHWAVGGKAWVGFFSSFYNWIFEPGDTMYSFGGQMETSYQNGGHELNFSLMVFGGGFYDEPDGHRSGKNNVLDAAIILPNIGYRYAFHKNWSFQTELTAVLAVAKTGKGNDEINGEIWVFLYGLRGHGETLFGDIGFFLPMQKFFIDYMWQFAPLGIPYFSLGVHF